MPINKTAKQLAQAVAKQTVRESSEFLKTAREQISPIPQSQDKEQKNSAPEKKPEDQKPPVKNMSFMTEYRQELNEIRRENLYEELLKKITEGEIIPLEDYAKELSFEQREVLKAQMEAVKGRQEQDKHIQKTGLSQIISKQGRRMFNRIKKQNEMHVETRQPPSS